MNNDVLRGKTALAASRHWTAATAYRLMTID